MASTAEAFILRLPDELLDKIFRSFAPVSFEHSRSHHEIYQQAWILTRVCRRFNQVATPYLYSSLYFDCESPRWPKLPAQAWNKLHRTLKENPALWPMCKKLRIEHQDGRHPSNVYEALDLATWLTETRSLSVTVHGGIGSFKEAWSIVARALENMPDLTELGFHDWYYRNTPISVVIDGLGALGGGSSLRTLDLSGISTINSHKAWGKLKVLVGTAPFTELKLYGFLQTPEILADLVAWPAKLERFSFRFSFPTDYSSGSLYDEWSLGTMREVLDSQKINLRSIVISHIHESGHLDNFDLSEFTSLEDLSLSHGATGHDDGSVANLIAPHLRNFHWDLGLEDQQCGETLDHFDQEHEDWLRAFSDAAIKQECGLRKIKIDFTPETWFRNTDPEDPLKYPWDRMDAIADKIRPHGIEMSYNTPTISKHEYLEALKEQRNELIWMPLWIASHTNNHERMEELLRDTIPYDSRCHGRTVVSWAAEQGVPLFVSILLDRGAHVDSQDDISLATPLQVAAKLGHTSVVGLLLERGAKTELKDHPDGRTALLYAAEKGHHDIVRLLLSRHADVHAKDAVYGKDPLTWAAENSHVGVVVALRERRILHAPLGY